MLPIITSYPRDTDGFIAQCRPVINRLKPLCISIPISPRYSTNTLELVPCLQHQWYPQPSVCGIIDTADLVSPLSLTLWAPRKFSVRKVPYGVLSVNDTACGHPQ
jgi:hypothetical protein